MGEVSVEACKVFTTVAKLPLSAVEVLSTAGIITVTGGATVTSSAGTRKPLVQNYLVDSAVLCV